MAASASARVSVSAGGWTAVFTGKANAHLQVLGQGLVHVAFGSAPPSESDPSLVITNESGIVSFTGMDASTNAYAKAVLADAVVAVLAY